MPSPSKVTISDATPRKGRYSNMKLPDYRLNRVRTRHNQATEPKAERCQTRVFVMPDGRLVIVSGTPRVFNKWLVRNAGWFDLSDVVKVHGLPVRQKDTPLVVASLVRMFKSEGLEVAYPRSNGRFVAWDVETDEVLATGSVGYLRAELKVDGRRFYRVQVTGRPIVANKRAIEITPVDLFGPI